MSDIPLFIRIMLSAGSFSIAIGVCLLLISFYPWKKAVTNRLIMIGAMMMALPFAACIVLFFGAIGISFLR